jgi:hypothetical protein
MRENIMFTRLSRHYSIGSLGLLMATLAGLNATAQMSASLVGLIAGESLGRGEVRPVFGVLGASSIQAPVNLPREISLVWLAPTGSWTLVQQRGAMGLITFAGSAPGAVQSIAGPLPTPDLVSFSPMGGYAGLYSASSGFIQILNGLGPSPHAVSQVNFYDPSGVKKIAVSDDGRLLMILTAAGQVYIVSSSMTPMLAYAGSPTLGIVFLPNQSTAVIADGANGTLSLVVTADGVPQVQTVANSLSLNSAGEMLVAASRDGTAAFVVAAGSASASRVDLTAGSTQTATLPAVATRLDRLRDGESFVFSAEPGHPAWILAGRDSGLQTVFAVEGTAPGGDGGRK